MLFLLLLAWPLVHVGCPSYEVAMFQPRTVTPPYLVFVGNCYVATPFFLTRSTLLPPPPDLPLGEGLPHPPLDNLLATSVVQPHSIILPPGHHLSLSHHTQTHCSLTLLLNPLRPYLLLQSHHACRISNAATLPTPKYLLIQNSDDFWPPFASTTSPGASLSPMNLSLCHKPPRQDATPPTPPLLPVSCQYTCLGDEYLPSPGQSLLTPSAMSCPLYCTSPCLLICRSKPTKKSSIFLDTASGKPRSPPRKGRLTGLPLIKTWQTLVDPPPTAIEIFPVGSRPFGTCWRSEGLPASCCQTGPRCSPGT